MEKNSQHFSGVFSTFLIERFKRNKHNNEIFKLVIKVILYIDDGYKYKAGKCAWEFALVKRMEG